MPRAGPPCSSSSRGGRGPHPAHPPPPPPPQTGAYPPRPGCADVVAASPDCEARYVIAPSPAKTTSRLLNFMFNVLPGGRRGAASENIGMAFNCFLQTLQVHCITIV